MLNNRIETEINNFRRLIVRSCSQIQARLKIIYNHMGRIYVYLMHNPPFEIMNYFLINCIYSINDIIVMNIYRVVNRSPFLIFFNIVKIIKLMVLFDDCCLFINCLLYYIINLIKINLI